MGARCDGGSDACGRVVERHSGEATTTFTYDSAGHLVAAVTPDTRLALTRDALGRVVTEECDGRALHSTYDILGRRVERRTPSGAVSRWEWDANNRPTRIRLADHALSFTYGASGHEIERRLGETAVLSQEWDAGHRLTSRTVLGQAASDTGPSGEALLQRSYTYGQDGSLAAVEDQTYGVRRFTRDRLGRVETVSATGWSERYAYDAAGNVSGADAPEGVQGRRVHDGTLIRRAGHITYVHDAQGRLVRQTRKLLSGGTREWTYAWDAEDRLTQVTTPDGRRWAYVYDGLGRRVAKRLLSDDGRPVEETVFTWDSSHLVEQSSSAGGPTQSWEWAPGTNRALLQSDQDEVDRRFYAIVTDLVGTPTELVDDEGRIAWRSRTTLWGTPLGGAADRVDCPLRFPGQYHDPETGLHYNFRRYYDPENARYISPDPLGLAPAPNHHAYVPDPLRWTDPWGLVSCESSRHGIAEEREAHIEGQHGPGAQDRVRENADPTGPEPSLPGEFYDDFLWDGDTSPSADGSGRASTGPRPYPTPAPGPDRTLTGTASTTANRWASTAAGGKPAP
ncbi:RHS repeat domain-containing protein [Streptomyces sp. NPDC058001]|uniref:RHS repeat domain-containing protein n=1 Tax=Streptomyces sp. NPDC058001 TaxID=3346300 RepID=UPI0036EE44CD